MNVIIAVIAPLYVVVDVLRRNIVRIRTVCQTELRVCETRVDVRCDEVRVALNVLHAYRTLLARFRARKAMFCA